MLSCVLLCGGLATRLYPVTQKIPKSLIEINGEPFLAHQLRLLRSKGINRAVLCVGYLGDMIQQFAGDGAAYGVHLTYSFDGPHLRGTAGAIRNAIALLDDRFFVVYGDSYLPCDYAAVGQAFEQSGKRALMTIYRNEGSFDTSNVEAEKGVILKYDKRERTQRMHYIDYGLGVFDRSVFESLAPDQSFDLAEIYQHQLAEGDLASYEVTQRFYEIGSLPGIADLEKYLNA